MEPTAAVTFRNSLFQTVSELTMVWLSGTQMVCGPFLADDSLSRNRQPETFPFRMCPQPLAGAAEVLL
jgi:hypothetical protein